MPEQDPAKRTEVMDAIASGAPKRKIFDMAPGDHAWEKAAYIDSLMRDGLNSGQLEPAQAFVTVRRDTAYELIPYEDIVEKYNAMIRSTRVPVRKQPAPMKDKGRTLFIVTGDTHAPNHNENLLMYLSKKHVGRDLYIAGDLFDFVGISKFQRKFRNTYTNQELSGNLLDILQSTAALVEAISPYWRSITVVRGNHDERLAGALTTVIPDGAQVADYLLDMAFASIANFTITGRRIQDLFMTKIGDCWLGHWDFTSKIPVRAATNAIEWMMQDPWVEKQGPWSTLIQAHTHQIGSTYHMNKLAIECGACLGYVPDYYWEKSRFRTPRLGYVELYQDAGITDHQETRVVNMSHMLKLEKEAA